MFEADVQVNLLSPDAVMPSQAYPGDAGFDLVASREMWLQKGIYRAIHTDVSLIMSSGWVAFVCPRSGLAMKHGITVLNAPGIIDSGYRGELMVLLINHGPEAFHVTKGMKIAQLVFQKTPQVRLVLAQFDLEEPTTLRGELGFGSSGI